MLHVITLAVTFRTSLEHVLYCTPYILHQGLIPLICSSYWPTSQSYEINGPRAAQSTYCTWRGEVGVRRCVDQYVGKNTKLSVQIAPL